ncbi:hypothetical protein AB4571_02715 [Vibrio breoganii]|uniref:hypothetical protein n=1 Tax=Vibrio breoganii TaxID=553239 RepID=UPI0012EA7C61|nr:hypothetical protein [Vibrio breoganii]
MERTNFQAEVFVGGNSPVMVADLREYTQEEVHDIVEFLELSENDVHFEMSEF